ncbi:MAG: hypothetical protein IJW18_06865 [Lachnospiraceae bacterium]|nr:hypothetical protein [Lachnospiraceae bacterium]
MVKTYKCPGCGADMKYDAEAKKLSCEYCETSLTVDEAKALEETKQQEADDKDSEEVVDETNEADSYGEAGDFIKYKCATCGAELMTDEHTAATFCNYCGSPNLLSERIEGEKTPAMLIPFKITKEKAKEIYYTWCKKGALTPGEFFSQSTLEKMSAIYVPFWLYDYGANVKMRAHCTRVRSEVRGNYRYTHTSHYRVLRDVSAEYLKIPADASQKMPDDVMDKLEPFNYGEMTAFEMPYLSGYMAEKYNFTSEEMAKRVEARVAGYISQEGRSTINGYSTVAVTAKNVWLAKRRASYVMLPVWMLTYRYKGKEHIFAINGQTGKLVGKRPISAGKCLGWYFGMLGVFTLISSLVGVFVL